MCYQYKTFFLNHSTYTLENVSNYYPISSSSKSPCNFKQLNVLTGSVPSYIFSIFIKRFVLHPASIKLQTEYKDEFSKNLARFISSRSYFLLDIKSNCDLILLTITINSRTVEVNSFSELKKKRTFHFFFFSNSSRRSDFCY